MYFFLEKKQIKDAQMLELLELKKKQELDNLGKSIAVVDSLSNFLYFAVASASKVWLLMLSFSRVHPNNESLLISTFLLFLEMSHKITKKLSQKSHF